MPRSRQVREIERQQRSPAARRRLMDQLRRRHRQQGLGLELRETRGRDLLLVGSELLVEPAQLTDAAREVISAAGFEIEEVEGLRNRVARIWRVQATPAAVDELRDELERVGVIASRSYVTPNSPIDKSDATPERAHRRRRVEVPPADPAVRVAILDTGVRVTDRNDGWLDGLQRDDNEDPIDVYPPLGSLDYAAGHGTFIAGQFRQVDDRLDVRIERVLDSDGVAGEVNVAVAMVAAAEEHLAHGGKLVLNLSLGTDTLQDEVPLALRVAVEIIGELEHEADGGGEVMLVCAAGNEGAARRCWPAAFADGDYGAEIVAVAALDLDLEPAGWSTRGEWVTCSAVGESLRSTFVKGSEDPDLDPDPETFGDNAWATWTGTSFAAPLVAAHIASIARSESIPLTAARDALFSRAAIREDDHYGMLLDVAPD